MENQDNYSPQTIRNIVEKVSSFLKSEQIEMNASIIMDNNSEVEKNVVVSYMNSAWTKLISGSAEISPEATMLFVKLAGELADATLITAIWKEYMERGVKLSPMLLVSCAKTVGLTQQRDLLNEIWEHLKSYIGSKYKVDVAAVAKSAALVGDIQIIREVWSNWKEKNIIRNSSTRLSIAQAASKVGDVTLIPQIWKEEYLWPTSNKTTLVGYMNVISQSNLKGILEQVIESCINSNLFPDDFLSRKIKETASSVAEDYLIKRHDIYLDPEVTNFSEDSSAVLRQLFSDYALNKKIDDNLISSFSSLTWDELIKEICKDRHMELCKEICRRLPDSLPTFKYHEWKKMARTIIEFGQKDMLADYWKKWKNSDFMPDSEACIALVKAIDSQSDVTFVDELITYIRTKNIHFGTFHYLALLKATVVVGDSALQSIVWQEWQKSAEPTLDECLKPTWDWFEMVNQLCGKLHN